MSNLLAASTIAGLLAVASLGLASAQTPAASHVNQCFRSTDWQGWKAKDDKTLYIHVEFNKVYRLDMAGSCSALLYPGSHLITVIRGSDEICSPLDIDLKVSEGEGFAMPCIVDKMTLLTPTEAAAIPKKDRPY